MSESIPPVGSTASYARVLDPSLSQVLLLAIGVSTQPLNVAGARGIVIEAGIDASESTVARRLRELDAAGLTTPLGKRGRVLTSEGRLYVDQQLRARRREELISSASTVESATVLVNLLRARCALEPEVAREAALRATPADVAELWERQHAYEARVEQGGDFPRDLSLELHRRLLRTSQNALVVASLEVALDPRLDRIDAPIEMALKRHDIHQIGSDDHREILTAIEAGDAAAAEQAMRSHMTTMVEAVESFAAGDRDGVLDLLLAWTKR